MTKPLYVSFYTPDYGDYAENLIESLKRHRLFFVVMPVVDRGSWQRNCMNKPKFIWDVMTGEPGRPVVWIDADAEVLHYPSLFEKLECDFAAVRSKRENGREELLSGTLYFRNTAPSQKLVDHWIEVCVENPTLWDQACLAAAVERTKPLAVENLPQEFCFIYDTHRTQYPKMEPVIEHYQASRKVREKKP